MESQHTGVEIIGSEAFVNEQLELINRLAATQAPVLICGETGVGKELMARTIHMSSPGSQRAFVAVSSSNLDDNIFAAAGKNLPDAIGAQGAGTLFLDDVGDLSETAQAGVLKLLQAHPSGGKSKDPAPARILASANINMQSAVDTGKFRSDLFFRLNEFSIHIKPLRERREDIPALANYFITQFNNQYGKKVDRISDAALGLLNRYSFPGNVRELRNMIQSAVLMNDRKVIWVEDLPLDIVTRNSTALETGAGLVTLKQIERLHIETVLDHAKWNVSRAARILGITRATLYDKIKAFGLARS